MKNILKNVLKYGLPLAMGVGLFWYIYSQVNMQEIANLLNGNVAYGWVVLAGLIGILSHIFRAIRWRIQLQQLGLNPTLNSAINAIFGTYAVNLLLPRAGEVWRCGYMAKRENSSFSKILGSMFSDRFSDAIVAGLITGIIVAIQMPFFVRLLKGNTVLWEKVQDVLTSPLMYILLIVFILGITLLFSTKKGKTLWPKIKIAIQNMKEGFLSIIYMKKKGLFILLTIGIWLCYFMELYVCFWAFSFSSHLGLVAALTVFVMGSLSVILPVQGSIGPWHFAVISSLLLYGIGQTEAATLALITHGVQTATLVLLGIYTFISISMEQKKANSESITETST